jgi:hypothetical protein
MLLKPFVELVAWGEKTKDDEAELGLVDAESQLESSGLKDSPGPVWKLMPHMIHWLAIFECCGSAARLRVHQIIVKFGVTPRRRENS